MSHLDAVLKHHYKQTLDKSYTESKENIGIRPAKTVG